MEKSANTVERAGYHLKEILKIETAPAVWPHMIRCALATGVPLWLGLMTGHLLLAIYGSLAGYLLCLNDHFGALGHRLWIITLTFLLLIGSFVLGVYLHQSQLGFILAFFCMAYWLGLLGGDGAELEKAVLFSLIMILTANSRTGIDAGSAHLVLYYAAAAFVVLTSSMVLFAYVRGHNPDPHVKLRESFRKSLTRAKTKHFHATSYALTAIIAYYASAPLGVDKGYWTAVTVLIIMKPDRTQSFYRSMQRFIGTVAGVLAIEALITVLRDELTAVLLITVASFFVPWAAKKSYWLMSFFVTLIVLLLLDLPYLAHTNYQTPLIRLYATGIGCVFALLGGLLTLGLDLIFKSLEQEKETGKNKKTADDQGQDQLS